MGSFWLGCPFRGADGVQYSRGLAISLRGGRWAELDLDQGLAQQAQYIGNTILKNTYI